MRCFVYGTLRPGDYNFDRVGGDDGSIAPMPATAKGKIYCVSEFGGYPVAKFNEDGIITGDVVYFGPEQWQLIVDIEVGAGYEMVEIPITFSKGGSATLPAWHYIGDPRGPWIESGDWFKHNESVFDEG